MCVCATFSADEQRGHLKHVLHEGVRVFGVQSVAHLRDHQFAEVRLAVCRLGKMQHPGNLNTHTLK